MSRLPNALVASAAAIAPQFGSLRLDDIRVYASVNADRPNDGKLRNWLETFLDRQPGFRVFIRDRKSRVQAIRCRACGGETEECPHCHAKFERAAEKGVDAAILTDMFSLACGHGSCRRKDSGQRAESNQRNMERLGSSTRKDMLGVVRHRSADHPTESIRNSLRPFDNAPHAA